MIWYLLLWLTVLSAALFFTASFFHSAGRFKKGGKFFILSWGILSTAGAGLPAWGAWYVRSQGMGPDWLFSYTLSFFLIYLASIVAIARIQFKGFVGKSFFKNKAFFLFLFFLLLSAAIALYLDSGVKAELAEIKREAQKLMDSVNAKPIKEEENAVTYYEEAFKVLGDSSELPKWFKNESHKPAFHVSAPKVAVFMEEKKPVLELLDKATSRENYYLYTKADCDLEIHLYTPYRNSARILSLAARIHAARGDAGKAIETLKKIWKISEHIEKHPLLISYLISVSIESIGVRAMERSLYDLKLLSLDDSDLISYEEKTYLEGLSRSMKGETAFNMGCFSTSLSEYYLNDNDSADRGRQGIVKLLLLPLYRIFFAREDISFVQPLWTEMPVFFEKPYYKSFNELRAWEEAVANKRGGPMSSMWAPNFSHYFSRVALSKARMLLARLGLAAQAYKSQTGNYPASPEELIPGYLPSLPLDPFDGNHLRMKAVEGGLILYSIGKDLTDDGGMELDHESKKGDITFLLGSAFEDRRLAEK